MLTKQKIKHDATIFISIVLTLVTLGIIFVYSSSSYYAFETLGQSLYYVKKQCIGIFCGLLAVLIAYLLPLRFFKEISFFIWGRNL